MAATIRGAKRSRPGGDGVSRINKTVIQQLGQARLTAKKLVVTKTS